MTDADFFQSTSLQEWASGMGSWTQTPCVYNTSEIASDTSFFVLLHRYDLLHHMPTYANLFEN